MKKKVVLVAFADQLNVEWIAKLKAFPADSVVFTGPASIASTASAACANIYPDKSSYCAFLALKDTGFESVLEALQMLKTQMPNEVIVVNIDAASKQLSSTAIAAANSTDCLIGFTDEQTNAPKLLLPIKFSYCSNISSTKQKILEALKESPANSLRQLANKVGLPLSLASYHVHGDSRSEGLSQLRMLEIAKDSGRLKINLAPLGRIYLKGCNCSDESKQAIKEKIVAKRKKILA